MQSDASVSDEFPLQAPSASALADGRRSDMNNPQVYIRHKDVRPSSHQKKIEEKKILPKNKKWYSLCFPILGGRNLTRALKASPFKKYNNLKFFLKIIKKKKKIAEKRKKNHIWKTRDKNAIRLLFERWEDAIRPELSSPARFRNTKISKNLKKSLKNIYLWSLFLKIVINTRSGDSSRELDTCTFFH